MKVPVLPPDMEKIYTQDNWERVMDWGRILKSGPPRAEVEGEYLHWDKLRHLTPPDGLTHEQWWLAIKLSRLALARILSLHDKDGAPFTVSLSESIERRLFFIGRDAAGSLKGFDGTEDESSKDRYLVRSLIEEAMTSSQLEGAATTTQVAKDMLRTGRKPRDYGERMIYNNFNTMRELKRWVEKPLTPDTVFEIHRMLTSGTLKEECWAGRFRTAEDNIVVEDETGCTLHVPPKAEELPQRLQMLCDFANAGMDSGPNFLNPVVRAILIHFQIGYDHPFCDGNGRTARALFYWAMLRSGFWLMEYVSISSILRKTPGQYMRAYLYAETDKSDATYFVDQQLNVIVAAINGLHDYLARKRKAQQRAETLLKPGSALARKLNHRQRALLLDALRHPEKPYIIEGHRRSHDVTYQTARSDLLGLVEERLLTQYKQGRAFVFIPAPDLPERIKR
ncbi:MAG: Fic family protein [Lysobacter sp.]|nr:MAG: Fic family protein [Lysobacter sp.]